jgi:hypothetical protein
MMFGGKRYAIKKPISYNSRFNAHEYVAGSGAIHAISAACHWDFGGMNIVHTFKHFINEEQAQACGKTTDTLLLDYIGFSLNAENPDKSMECRSTYPPIMRCSFPTSTTSVVSSFQHLLEQCVAPPDNALICDVRLQHINEIKQVIIQMGHDDFCTYVRETMHSNRWYKFDARAIHFHNMEVPLCGDEIDISQARHCWACTAPLLEDADVIHNAMMENVRQSMRRYIVQQVTLRVGDCEMPTSTTNETASSSTYYNIEDDDFIDEQEVAEVNPDDVNASIGTMERFLDTASWDPQALRQAIIDMDIGDGDKHVSGDIVVDSGEDGVPVFDYENRPFTVGRQVKILLIQSATHFHIFSLMAKADSTKSVQ